MRGEWNNCGWDKYMLVFVFNNINDLFYYEENNKKIKIFKKMCWETVYWKTTRNNFLG